MSESSQKRSERFLSIASQFKLGGLVTEASHPVTAQLSEVARGDVKAALKLLFEVDEDVSAKFRELVDSSRLPVIADETVEALRKGGRLFFTGCGSTGRLSILLDSVWRDFWQQQPKGASSGNASAGDWEDRTFSVMAGGDFALIKAVEGFEDYASFGRKQLKELGVRAGDVVFAITEGGETSFVIGTAWEGLEAGAKVYFVYNNPDEILCRTVERSREVMEEPRIEKLNLTTGPMAISGSTRMQATSIQLCVLLTVLEMVIRRLASELRQEPQPDLTNIPSAVLAALMSLLATLKSEPVLSGLAELVHAESDAYVAGGRANYSADHLAIDVLTDTTERSPTFCTPAFRKSDDHAAAESWAFLQVATKPTREAWEWILKRAPRCIEWDETDVNGLVSDDRLQRTAQILRGITTDELMKFEIGREGMFKRPLRQNDFALTILAPESESHVRSLVGEGEGEGKEGVRLPDEVQAGEMRFATTCKSGVLCFSRREENVASSGQAIRSAGEILRVNVPVPNVALRLDGIMRVAAKLVLNALSTCVMVRLGRVMGNTMIYVVPSNLKLIDRATRYIARLASLEYPAANRLLFEAIEYVEPRMLAGRAYPPVVGLAVLRATQSLAFEQAEKKLT